MTAADRLRALVKEATFVPAGKGPEFKEEWDVFGRADDWLTEHALQLAELVADMGEILERLMDYVPAVETAADDELDALLARLDALFTKETT